MNTRIDASFLFFISLLSMLYLWASDMYLPAFNDMSISMQATKAEIGYSLSIYFLAFSFSQVFFGAISDQVGRKPMLLIGSIIFIFGSSICMLSSNIGMFYFGRVLMAIGACSAFVLWQAMIIDVERDPGKIQRTFAFVYMLLGLSPAIAPVVGGILSSYISWKYIFLMLSLYGVMIFGLTCFYYKETLKRDSSFGAHKFNVSKLTSDYKALFDNRRFLSMALMIGVLCGIYMTYITLVPFIFGNLGLSNGLIGLSLLPIAITFVIGTRVAVYLTKFTSPENIILLGVVVSVIPCGTIFYLSIFTEITGAAYLIFPMMLITFCNGLSIPFGMATLVKENEDIAGTCSSFLGFFIAIVPFIFVSIGSKFIELHGTKVLGMILLSSILLALFLGYLSERFKQEFIESV